MDQVKTVGDMDEAVSKDDILSVLQKVTGEGQQISNDVKEEQTISSAVSNDINEDEQKGVDQVPDIGTGTAPKNDSDVVIADSVNGETKSNDVKEEQTISSAVSNTITLEDGTVVDEKTRKIIKGAPQQTNKNKKPGPPSMMDEKRIDKLKTAFLMGCTDREACLYADISEQLLYKYQSNNPEFMEKKATWKENPVLKARSTVYSNLSEPETARWFLERKARSEFATRQEVTGADGNAIELTLDRLEGKSDYLRVADEAAKQLNKSTPGEIDGQMVENDAPVQGEEQTG